MVLFAGDDGPLCKPEHLDEWAKQTTGSTTTHVYQGDHIYLRNHLPELTGQLMAATEDVLAAWFTTQNYKDSLSSRLVCGVPRWRRSVNSTSHALRGLLDAGGECCIMAGEQYLCAEPNGTVGYRSARMEWETFRLVPSAR
jgi:hypothetical protein